STAPCARSRAPSWRSWRRTSVPTARSASRLLCSPTSAAARSWRSSMVEEGAQRPSGPVVEEGAQSSSGPVVEEGAQRPPRNHDWQPELVALDIDGTLLSWMEGSGVAHGEVRPAVVEAVRRVVEAGAHVV